MSGMAALRAKVAMGSAVAMVGMFGATHVSAATSITTADCTLITSPSTVLACGAPPVFHYSPHVPATPATVGSLPPIPMKTVAVPSPGPVKTVPPSTTYYCAYSDGANFINPTQQSGRYGQGEANSDGGPMGGPLDARTFAAASADPTFQSDASNAADTTGLALQWDSSLYAPAVATVEWHVEGAIDANSQQAPLAGLQGGNSSATATGSENVTVDILDETTGSIVGQRSAASWSQTSSGYDGLKDNGYLSDSAKSGPPLTVGFTLTPGDIYRAEITSTSSANAVVGAGIVVLPGPFPAPTPVIFDSWAQTEFHDTGSGGSAEAVLTLVEYGVTLPPYNTLGC